MSRYLVKLKPIDKFFFGGDMTFAIPAGGDDRKKEKEKENENERFSSYIITSGRFPQQTSLLGMLRFLLLRNSAFFKDGKIENKDKVKELIGQRSFMVSKGTGDFGQIKALSACFLMNSQEHYYLAPLDVNIAKSDGTGKPAEAEDAGNSSKTTGYVNGKEITLPEFKGYSPKNENPEYVIGENGKFVELSDIFKDDRRIGIARNINTGRTEDASLFKQISYRLKDDWYFAFYVDVSKDCNIWKYSNQIVSVGGDSSQFVITINKLDPPESNESSESEPKTSGSNQEKKLKVVLLSPSFIPRKLIVHDGKPEDDNTPYFFISKTVPFRFMETTIDTEDYTLRAGYQRSSRYELYASGSVFYFDSSDKAESFKKAVEGQDKKLNSFQRTFRQIGYNECKLI